MTNNHQPKFAHILANKLVDSRTKRHFLSASYIQATDLLWLQSRLFEMCCVLGIRFVNKPFEFFRVLFADETQEQQEDARGHSCLMLGFGDGQRPIHVVCSPKDEYLAIITAYLPDGDEWSDDLSVRL